MNEHIEPLLDRYRTGELPDDERTSVEEHLAACASCAEALKRLEAFSATVARGYEVARAAGPEPDWVDMRQRVVERTSARRSRGFRWARYAPQAAVATIAVIAVGVLVRQGVREPGDADRIRPLERPTAVGGRADAPEAGDDRERFADGVVDERSAEAALRPEALQPELEGEPARQEARRPVVPPRALEDAAVGAEVDDTEVAGAAGQVGPAGRERNDQVVSRKAPLALEGALEAEAREELDVVDRFELRAKRAFANRDTAEARASSRFFRDSVASRDDLDPERLRVARAWADSLAALLAARP